MANLSPNEIAGLIYFVQGWGPGNAAAAPKFLDVAIAVCLSESGGNINAVNGANVKGLWQIDIAANQAIAYAAVTKYGTKDPKHPYANTAMARDVYTAAGGWSPWTVYTKGTYKKNLGHGAEAYKWIQDKKNLIALQTKLTSLGYPVVSISAEDIANSNSTIIGPNLVQSNLGEQAGKVQNMVSDAVTRAITALKEMGTSVGIFLLGAVVLILGAWFLLSRAGVRTPQGTLAKAAKDVLAK